MYDHYPDVYLDSAGAAAIEVVMAILLVVVIVLALLALAVWVIQSYSVYSLARRRGIRHPWLAWIPLGHSWILGSISDQYQYLTKGKIKNRRIVLLTLGIVPVVIGIVSTVLGFSYQIRFLGLPAAAEYYQSGQVFLTVLLSGLLSVISFSVSVAAAVFSYMCLYDLYNSCNPQNAVLFLVLSILFCITTPFFILYCRNKDQGMPPRKPVEPPFIRE